MPDLHRPASLIQAVKDGIGKCHAAGFGKGEVALLSFRGREGSRLFGFTQFGTHTLRTVTGDYDAGGRPVYSDGDVVAESAYRFKGQSAPAVVLAEIDFDALDEKTVRKLFVGATRASMKLVLVLSENAAGVLLGKK